MQDDMIFPNSAHGQRFQWDIFLGIIILHVGALAALWYAVAYGVSFSAALLAIGYTVMRGVGVSVGYHRMLTHRSFKTNSELLRRFLFYWGGVGGQNARTWRANHLDHHRYGDTARDPYSVYWPYNGGWKGLLWAHIGALWHEYTPTPKSCAFAPDDINKDAAEWEAKYHNLIFLSGFLVPAFLLGWEGLLFPGFASLFYVFHLTWSVNSICHIRRRGVSSKDVQGRNSLFVILGGFIGEGFHINHHTYPTAAFLGPKWWHLDFGKWVILTLEMSGLVFDVKRPHRSA